MDTETKAFILQQRLEMQQELGVFVSSLEKIVEILNLADARLRILENQYTQNAQNPPHFPPFARN